MDFFLKAIEKRAYKIAEFATSDRDEALDLVQNTMIKLVQRYAGRPEPEWTLLFYRILQNEIRDWKRKAWIRGLFHQNDDNVDLIKDERLRSHPDRVIQQDTLSQKIHLAIKRLPFRQQQVFLLRNYEGLDVNQTAKAMNCSPGSVKTHYSRALDYLREQLEDEA